MLALEPAAQSFEIESLAGISGRDVQASFPCALSGAQFFVHLGATPLALFDKHSFMNLAELAEAKGATRMVFLLSAAHPQLPAFRRTFKVLDAERVPTAQVQQLLRGGLAAKEVTAVTKFYQMDL